MSLVITNQAAQHFKSEKNTEESKDTSVFKILPEDLLQNFFAALGLPYLPEMGIVSKKWNRIINEKVLGRIQNNLISIEKAPKPPLPNKDFNSFVYAVIAHFHRILPEFSDSMRTELSVEMTVKNFPKILEVCKARDTLVFRKQLVNKNLNFSKILSVEKFFEKANGCKDWYSHQDFSEIKMLYLNKERIGNLFQPIIFLPNEIDFLKNLELFDLSDNHLMILPNEMESLTRLIILTLNSNKLSIIPSNIFKLKSLIRLNLANNPGITSLPDELWEMRNLTELNLSECQISTIPGKIGQLKNLEELNFANNPNITSLPDELWEMTNLTELNLAGCQINSISEKIGQLKNLKKINLAGNPCIQSLPKVLKSMKSQVILHDNQHKKKKTKHLDTCIIS
jgi:Leucine-rich repeat (LRR) protein